MKKHNFYAGPSILPEIVYEKTKEAIDNFAGTGVSIMSISHRSKQFEAVITESQEIFKELLNIPEGYQVIFVGGGASTQFFTVPYNLMEKKAAYLNTGTWANTALKEAKNFGEVIEVASSADKNYNYIPKGFKVPNDVDTIVPIENCFDVTQNSVKIPELKAKIGRIIADKLGVNMGFDL